MTLEGGVDKRGFTDADVPDQSGRCIMVTGANTGLGFETARILASKGARVLLACRNKAKAEAAIGRIHETFPRADLSFVQVDQADLSSVREAAKTVEREQRLDVLINNAGIMSSRKDRTQDGFEDHMGINHLGSFALTALLLPRLAEQKGSRVVITSSLAHRRGRIDFDDWVEGEKSKPGQLYSNSKLANLLFAWELDRRLRAADMDVSAVACHPGMASSELFRDGPGFIKALAPLLGRLVNSALQGAWPTLQAATDPRVESGDYYGPQRLGGIKGPSGPAQRSQQARSPALAEQLWDASERLSGIKFRF